MVSPFLLIEVFAAEEKYFHGAFYALKFGSAEASFNFEVSLFLLVQCGSFLLTFFC